MAHRKRHRKRECGGWRRGPAADEDSALGLARVEVGAWTLAFYFALSLLGLTSGMMFEVDETKREGGNLAR